MAEVIDKELTERMANNLRKKKITHLPPGLDRLEANFEEFLKICKERELRNETPILVAPSSLTVGLILIIKEIKELKDKVSKLCPK